MIISDVKIGIFHHFQLSPFFQKSQDSQLFPNGFVIVNGLLQHSKALKNHNVGQSLERSENGSNNSFVYAWSTFENNFPSNFQLAPLKKALEIDIIKPLSIQECAPSVDF